METSATLSSILSKPPFKNKLIIGDCLSAVTRLAKANFFSAYSKNSICIVCTEKDFLLIGKSIKDAFLNCGAYVQVYICDFAAEDLLPCICGTELVVSVGDSDLAIRLAYMGKSNGFKVVSVITSSVFADIFSSVTYLGGGLEKVNAMPEFIVVDLNIYKNLKRADLADAYSFIAATCGVLSEYKLNYILRGEAYSSDVINHLMAGLKLLFMITPENINGVLIVSQLEVAKAISIMPEILACGSFCAAKVLQKMSSASFYECVYGLIGPLFTEFAAYIRLTNPIFVVPEYNKDEERLSEILNIDQTEIYKRLTVADFKEIEKSKQNLRAADLNGEVLKEINNCLSTLKEIKKSYAVVYKGRHNRAEFSCQQIKTALKLGGMISEGILKLMYDDGILGIFETI